MESLLAPTSRAISFPRWKKTKVGIAVILCSPASLWSFFPLKIRSIEIESKNYRAFVNISFEEDCIRVLSTHLIDLWSDRFTWAAPFTRRTSSYSDRKSPIKSMFLQSNHVAKKSTITNLSPAAFNSAWRLSLEISRTGIVFVSIDFLLLN